MIYFAINNNAKSEELLPRFIKLHLLFFLWILNVNSVYRMNCDDADHGRSGSFLFLEYNFAPLYWAWRSAIFQCFLMQYILNVGRTT